MKYEYRLRFYQNEASCIVLKDLVKLGWAIVGFKIDDDSCSWLILHLEET